MFESGFDRTIEFHRRLMSPPGAWPESSSKFKRNTFKFYTVIFSLILFALFPQTRKLWMVKCYIDKVIEIFMFSEVCSIMVFFRLIIFWSKIEETDEQLKDMTRKHRSFRKLRVSKAFKIEYQRKKGKYTGSSDSCNSENQEVAPTTKQRVKASVKTSEDQEPINKGKAIKKEDQLKALEEFDKKQKQPSQKISDGLLAQTSDH